ncbi:putative disease resistance protein RGA4 [Bienertia sinuspersici]
MPKWITFLTNIEHLHLVRCDRFEYLSGLVNFFHLKILNLFGLTNLEYIEEDSVQEELCFPTLETLELSNMAKLKGWRRREGIDDNMSNEKQMQQLQLHFPQLNKLTVERCPQLLTVTNTEKNGKLEEVSKLIDVGISNVAWLKSLPVEAYHCLDHMFIKDDEEVGSLGEIEEVFLDCSSSLKFLVILKCSNLSRVLCGGLEHLSALETLWIEDCGSLGLLEEEKKGDGIGINIMPSLYDLRLTKMLQLQSLPNWMQHLSRLQVLLVYKCKRVESMPNWMPKLTSLRTLNLRDCFGSLKKRCQKDPSGEDWPYIQHIPDIYID